MTPNKSQKQAVEHTGSPLLLVAGPGSGKTRVIIDRIVRLVNSGIQPDEILCLTFTKKATEEMSQRLENQDITDVQINTFHSFAKSVLQDNVLESGVNISSGVIKRSAQLAWGLKNSVFDQVFLIFVLELFQVLLFFVPYAISTFIIFMGLTILNICNIMFNYT
jgi:superfamily I DNA/RNA helicase